MSGALKQQQQPGTMSDFCKFQYSPTKIGQQECNKRR